VEAQKLFHILLTTAGARVPFAKRETGAFEWQVNIGSSGAGTFGFNCGSPTASNLIGVNTDVISATNEFVHVVITYDGSETKEGLTIYINGVDATFNRSETGTYTGMTATSARTTIGSFLGSNRLRDDELLDEVLDHDGQRPNSDD